MGRIVMFNQVSADGYFAAPDGNLDWVVHDPAVDKAAMEGGGEPDTLLLGRTTYEMFASFWPQAMASPKAQGPHGGGQMTKEQRDMGTWLNEARKVVFSRSLKDATWKNSRIVRELDPNEIKAMKKKGKKDTLVLGSGSIVSQLTEHGLIDEYDFVVSPVFLGKGKRLFDGVSKVVKLKLNSAKGYPSGCVLARYTRA